MQSHNKAGQPLLVGINGAQGTGKSTMASCLGMLLEHHYGLRCLILSIDDLYLTRQQRLQLADRVHPLLRSRGVPGTHDVMMGRELLQRICTADADTLLSIPRFDKARDDRAGEDNWPLHSGPVDVVLFEGWCVGTPPQTAAALLAPVNTLEAEEDRDGIWRTYVNDCLADQYPQLFCLIDYMIFLRAPDMQAVTAWRMQQEAEMQHRAGATSGSMSQPELIRFIQHFERLTRHNFEVMPGLADTVFVFDHEHRIVSSL